MTGRRTTRHRTRTVLAGLLLGPALLLAGCSGGDGQVQRRDGSAGQEADLGFVQGSGRVTVVPAGEREGTPTLAGPLVGGSGSFDLAAQRGKVVVVNVWASWCAPCRAEAPALQAAWAQLRGRGVQFVGVNTKDSATQARAFVAEFGLTYPSVADDTGEALLGFRDTLPPAAIPSTLVIDQQGRVAARVLGEVDRGTVVGLVEDVLGGRATR